MRLGLLLVVVSSLGCGEGTPPCPEGMSLVADRCVCDAPRYIDADGDGYGAGDPLPSCALRPGIVSLGGDCDDRDGSRHPGAEETCNGVDDDCDGLVDEDFSCAQGAVVACTTSCGTQGAMVCSESCALPDATECVPPLEVCNGVDDDCDGYVDEGVRHMTWLGVLDQGATLEAHVFGFPGGMIITSRALTTAALLVLDTEGARLRSDRALDHHLATPKIGRRGGEVVLRGVYTSPPTRPYCATLGPAPEFKLSAGFCPGELDPSTELLDVLTEGVYETWLVRVNGQIHAGVVNFGPAAITALTVDGVPLAGERAFGISHLDRFAVEGEGALRVYRREGGGSGSYVLEADMGPSIAASVTVGDGEINVAQARSPFIIVRRYDEPFQCASPGYALGTCNEGVFSAAVSVAGKSPISVSRIGRRTFAAYTADEGTALGFIELGEDDAALNHVAFGQAHGPFVEVFLVDVGETLPRVVARTSAGALHLFTPECALD
jgi:hypothetical protein